MPARLNKPPPPMPTVNGQVFTKERNNSAKNSNKSGNEPNKTAGIRTSPALQAAAMDRLSGGRSNRSGSNKSNNSQNKGQGSVGNNRSAATKPVDDRKTVAMTTFNFGPVNK